MKKTTTRLCRNTSTAKTTSLHRLLWAVDQWVKFRYVWNPRYILTWKFPLFYNNNDSTSQQVFCILLFGAFRLLISAESDQRWNTKTTANHTCKCNGGYLKWTNTIWILWELYPQWLPFNEGHHRRTNYIKQIRWLHAIFLPWLNMNIHIPQGNRQTGERGGKKP